MAQLQNQFDQSIEIGALTLAPNLNIIPVTIDSTVTDTLLAGQAVRIVANSAKNITVSAVTTTAHIFFGFIPFSRGLTSFKKLQLVDIACGGSVIWLRAGAAINKSAQVMVGGTLTAPSVITATTGKVVVGVALDKAAALNDLVRVLVANIFETK